MTPKPVTIFSQSRKQSLEQLAWITLKSRIRKVRHYINMAANHSEEDLEHVHQMRVWSRRTLAACELFQEQLSVQEFAWFSTHLKKVRKAADSARNCDVISERYKSMPVSTMSSSLIKLIQTSRMEAQDSIETVYQNLIISKELHTHRRALKKYLASSINQKKLTPHQFQSWSDKRLRPLIRNFNKATTKDLTHPSNLHRLRIRGKQLRYAFELVIPVYKPGQTKRLNKEFKKLQQRLGKLNDHYSAAFCFQSWSTICVKPRMVYHLQSLQAQELASTEHQRQKFLAEWTTERLKRLTDLFDQLHC